MWVYDCHIVGINRFSPNVVFCFVYSSGDFMHIIELLKLISLDYSLHYTLNVVGDSFSVLSSGLKKKKKNSIIGKALC